MRVYCNPISNFNMMLLAHKCVCTSAYAENIRWVGGPSMCPGYIHVHTAKRMWPYVAKTTSKCSLSDRSLRPQCVLGAFTSVLEPSTCDWITQNDPQWQVWKGPLYLLPHILCWSLSHNLSFSHVRGSTVSSTLKWEILQVSHLMGRSLFCSLGYSM